MMNKPVIEFLKKYSFEPNSINRLIVSCFLKEKNLHVHSDFLSRYFIQESDLDFPVFLEFSLLSSLDSIEKVIEAFEFVISPKEKVVTGAIYTPLYIREFITRSVFQDIDVNISELLIGDISCGCGGFLLTAAKIIHLKTNKFYRDIIKDNLWGLDIAEYSVERSKIVLSLLALENDEDVDLMFNIYLGNALSYSWNIHNKLKVNGGFDILLGNPPYVASRNINLDNLKLLNGWSVTESGHPDLYIPFFQIGMEILRNRGILGYITVNTFFKSLNGRALRSYFSEHEYNFRIIDFRGEQIFLNRITYTCICTIKKEKGILSYVQSESRYLDDLTCNDFSDIIYNSLNDFDGWNLGNRELIETISKMEKFETKIFSKYSFSTGIATLKNSIYIFRKIKSTQATYYFQFGKKIFEIEKSICREIVNANKVSTEEGLKKLKEQLIFPYYFNRKTKKYELIPKNLMRAKYPLAYSYLNFNAGLLEQRDKGKGKYKEWYAYGRNQGLNLQGVKLFLPHITNNPYFVISADSKLMFYNGEAVIARSELELLILKKILDSKLFWFYVSKTSKPYSSGYFSMSKNYIKNFSIPEFSKEERVFLKKEQDKMKVLSFLLSKYEISLRDIKL